MNIDWNIHTRRIYRILKWTGIVLLSVLGIACIVFMAFCEVGKQQLKGQAVTASHENLNSENSYIAPPQVVEYEGRQYRYNDALYVILCMGIDTENDLQEEGVPEKSGQSDANFLVVLDEKQERISILAIPRDTMTELDFYDVTGDYVGSIQEHLALQFAYGNGGSESCEMMLRAVSGLLYQMPMNGYVAFNLHSIKALNGIIGGVDVTLAEDFGEHQAGETIWLDNETAYVYVRGRDARVDYSADERLRRQKQYLLAFTEKALALTKQDIRQPFRIYQSLSDTLLTDVSMYALFSMVVMSMKCDFSEAYFYRVPGEQQLGELYEEYHVDAQALYEQVLEIFYLEEAAS